MARLIYSAIASLDGYTNDADGRFDWLAPDEEVHAFVNDCERPIGTYLYGRRMYDVMAAWETMDVSGDTPPMRDYQQIWQAADKVVYSRTLDEPRSVRTRIEREFDPEAVRALKASATSDISIGGPELAKQAIAAGLVDEISLFLNPIIIGGGNAALPDGVRIPLELVAERRFGNGVVYVSYAASGSDSS
jgi:dihydrofolate reductase